MAPDVRVALMPIAAADDVVMAEHLADLINRAYTLAERGMWKRDVPRTTADEVMQHITRQELAVASHADRLLGAVFVRMLDPNTGWFGALAVEPEAGGRGVGRQLVAFVEEHARTNGASRMQLELLVPDEPHPHTDRLAAWYASLGYRLVAVQDLVDFDADAVEYATCQIRVNEMHKSLPGAVPAPQAGAAKRNTVASSEADVHIEPKA